jgi:hypothetical protein
VVQSQPKTKRAARVTQVIECLPSKCKALNPNPSTTKTKQKSQNQKIKTLAGEADVKIVLERSWANRE